MRKSKERKMQKIRFRKESAEKHKEVKIKRKEAREILRNIENLQTDEENSQFEMKIMQSINTKKADLVIAELNELQKSLLDDKSQVN